MLQKMVFATVTCFCLIGPATCPAKAATYTTSGHRSPAEIQRGISACRDRLQGEPMANEICDAEWLITNKLGDYKPRDKKTFAACMKGLPSGKFAVQSRAICADSDATPGPHATGNLGNFYLQ